MNPLVTIIAISHHHSDFVIECLESVRSQSYQNIELIIINNFSDDRSSFLIKEWLRVNNFNFRFIENKEPLSVTQNLNMGLKFSSGKYFQGLSCDDVLLPNKISKQVELFENNPRWSVVSGSAILINEKGFKIGVNRKKKSRLEFSDFFYGRNNLIAPAVLIKKSDIDEIGGYDESIQIEDFYLWLKFTSLNKLIYQSSDFLVKYRIHGSNFTSIGHSERIFGQVLEILKIYKERKDFQIAYQEFLLKELVRNSRINKKFALTLFPKITWNNLYRKSFVKAIVFFFIPTFILKKMNIYYY
jgi:alpha-1,3-rhamnosyltransferase